MENPFNVLHEKLDEIQKSLKVLTDLNTSAVIQSQDTEVKEMTYNIKQLAAYLDCSRTTIHRYKKNKALPFKQVGRKVKFLKSEVYKAMSFIKKRGL